MSNNLQGSYVLVKMNNMVYPYKHARRVSGKSCVETTSSRTRFDL